MCFDRKSSWLREVVAVPRKNYMHHINTLDGQNYGLFNVDLDVLNFKNLIVPGSIV